MDELLLIARQVQAIGFRCTRCGACCTPIEEDSNLVMVTPNEIRRIIEYSNLSWEEVAEPYPDIIDDGKGHRYSIGWCVIRKDGHCSFFQDGRCRIYEKRPWICRTYPFVIEGNGIRSYPCPGVGEEISEEDALMIAHDLLARKEAESCDEESIRSVLRSCILPVADDVVIDSEGMKSALWPAATPDPNPQ